MEFIHKSYSSFFVGTIIVLLKFSDQHRVQSSSRKVIVPFFVWNYNFWKFTNWHGADPKRLVPITFFSSSTIDVKLTPPPPPKKNKLFGTITLYIPFLKFSHWLEVGPFWWFELKLVRLFCTQPLCLFFMVIAKFVVYCFLFLLCKSWDLCLWSFWFIFIDVCWLWLSFVYLFCS